MKLRLSCILIVFSVFLSVLDAYAQQSFHPLSTTKNIFWNALTSNNGLSQNSVTSIVQDSKGFIWIGTYDGLNRFDGFSSIVKRHESKNPNSLSDNRILSLHEDTHGNMLIATEGGGINIYKPASDSFSYISGNAAGYPIGIINALCSDADGNLWLGGNGFSSVVPASGGSYQPERIQRIPILEGLSVYSMITDKLGNIWLGTSSGLYVGKRTSTLGAAVEAIKQVSGFEHLRISSIYQDHRENIWIGSNEGLYTIGIVGNDLSNKLVIRNHTAELIVDNQPVPEITGIVTDLQGTVWISSRYNGLMNGKLGNEGNLYGVSFFNSEQQYCNLLENMLRVLFIDRSNTLWTGTYTKGVNYTNLSDKPFYTFNPLLSNERDEFGYKSLYVTTVLETDASVWVGTYNNGLYQYHKITGQLINYNRGDFKTNNIICLLETDDGVVWIGTDMGLFSYKNNHIRKLSHFNYDIRALCHDKTGKLWVAGLNRLQIYNAKQGQIDSTLTKNAYCTNNNFTLYADPLDSIVWVGTIGGGLTGVDYSLREKFQVYHYNSNPKSNSALSSNHVWSIIRDKKNILWVGTDAGLNKSISADNSKLMFEYVGNQLLNDRKITSILEDSQNSLWIGSSQGLLRYNTSTGDTRRYTHKDGLQSNTLTEAVFKNRNGMMFFGTINGLNYFFPLQIQTNPYPPSAAFIDLSIFNQSVLPGKSMNDQVILTKNINYTDRITLSHRQNNFLLSFASLHYALPESNRFRYRLEGYDKDWIETGGTQRSAAYSNLQAGTYEFQLMAANNDGVWDTQGKVLQITIEPAPWLTWWAKIIYVLVCAALVWMLVTYYRSKNKLRNELFLEKIEKEKVNELNELKLTFFTGITHELRTPLNLITGPLKELIKKIDEFEQPVQYRLQLIQRNVLRLSNLINQVLDLRKISNDSESLRVSQHDLIHVIAEIMKSFDWIAKQKKVEFLFNYTLLKMPAYFDKDKIEKVVFNLLSNAFKYVDTGGTVTITLSQQQINVALSHAVVTVTDNGPGIDEEDQSRIFQLFYTGTKSTNTGSGIGLALSSKLLQLHYGSISVNSKPGEGAAFSITFPISKEYYTAGEINELVVAHNTFEQLPEIHISGKAAGVKSKDKPPTVLIIDDEDDQRSYIRECLAVQFSIIDRSNGMDGFDTAIEEKPDLIISDVMMGGMKGTDLCAKLKSDSRTFHIPVILHSIKNSETAIQEALDAGADDVIPKPFDYTLLSVKINNILKSRNALVQSVHAEDILISSKSLATSAEEELLKRAVGIIEENMIDPEFNVEKLSRMVAMSRMNLHRKLLAVSGKTTSELIREVRMKKAAQLLASGNARVSEVMYEVGISSNFLFNKYFKDMYGTTVKEFQKAAK